MRQRRVIGRALGQVIAQEGTQGHRVRHSPVDAALRVQALKEADQQHAEVGPGWDPRA